MKPCSVCRTNELAPHPTSAVQATTSAHQVDDDRTLVRRASTSLPPVSFEVDDARLRPELLEQAERAGAAALLAHCAGVIVQVPECDGAPWTHRRASRQSPQIF